jgi:hypothetical protein
LRRPWSLLPPSFAPPAQLPRTARVTCSQLRAQTYAPSSPTLHFSSTDDGQLQSAGASTHSKVAEQTKPAQATAPSEVRGRFHGPNSVEGRTFIQLVFVIERRRRGRLLLILKEALEERVGEAWSEQHSQNEETSQARVHPEGAGS